MECQHGLAMRKVSVYMTLKGLIALILLYFTELDSSAAYYVTVAEDRPILSAEYRLPLLAKTNPPCSAVSLR